MSIILCIFSFATKNALIFATSLCILTSNFVSCYKYLYQAWDKFTQYSVINVFQSIGFSGVVVILGIFCKPVDAKKVIITYILINAICFVIVLREYIRGCKGIKRNPLISIENRNIFNLGILLMLSGAANVIFSSVHKYYI